MLFLGRNMLAVEAVAAVVGVEKEGDTPGSGVSGVERWLAPPGSWRRAVSVC